MQASAYLSSHPHTQTDAPTPRRIEPYGAEVLVTPPRLRLKLAYACMHSLRGSPSSIARPGGFRSPVSCYITTETCQAQSLL